MAAVRIEHDLLGEREVPAEALWGIHTLRAVENFPVARRPMHAALIHAYAQVKLAAVRTNRDLGRLDARIAGALESACVEMADGRLDAHVIVDALQGGAGTSANMNVNEVLANRALQLLGRPLGDYATVHPLGHVNLHQSTNDTFPTALRVAAIRGLRALAEQLAELVEAFQRQEQALASVVKIGRTEYQDAVLTTLGREMGAYAEAFGRDRWRVYKCEERLRIVNLGGTAIGTGLGAPRNYIFAVIDALRAVTGLGLARAENLIDCTQNADVFVEVSGILKACACNLLKIAGDLRLLSSGPHGGLGEIRLPPRQAGSSIMPSKVNPVIPEAVSQAAMMVTAYDAAITQAGSLGSLELNAFMPLIADSLLSQVDLLTQACRIFRELCIDGLQADADRCLRDVETASAVATALVEELGYERANELAKFAESQHCSIRSAALSRGLLSGERFDALVAADAVTRLGSAGRNGS